MRTTVEIPDELFRRAKEAALARGLTLKQVVISALRREVEEDEPIAFRRVEFPLVVTDGKGSVHVTAADIESLEIDDDAGR